MDSTDKLVAAQLAAAVIARREKAPTPRDSVETYLRICDHLKNADAIEAEMKIAKKPAKAPIPKPVFRK